MKKFPYILLPFALVGMFLLLWSPVWGREEPLSPSPTGMLASHTVSFDVATDVAAERTSPYLATITLNGSGSTTDDIVVNVTAADISTSLGLDYSFTNPTVITFPTGSQAGDTQSVNVTLLDDQLPEGDEALTLSLAIASGTATLGSTAVQTVTIKNNASLVSSLFWSDNNSIQTAALDGSNASTLISGLAPQYIAIDDINGKIYWADLDAEGIQRADLDGSNVEQALGGEVGDPLPGAPIGIALDIPAGKIYWSDDSFAISRADLDGSNIEMVVEGQESQPQDIGLDLINGKLYWAEEEVIFRANLADGSDLEEFFFGAAGGLHVDAANNYLYWTDFFDSQIHRTELDTGDDTIILDDLSVSLIDPRDIFADVASGKLFWANNGNESLERANLDGSGKEDLLTFISPPFGVATGGQSIVQQTITVSFTQATAVGTEDAALPAGLLTLATSDGQPTGQLVTIDMVVNGGGSTAVSPSDFILTTTYTIPAGTTPGVLDLSNLIVVDDALVETDETIQLDLSNPWGTAVGTQTSFTYTILNNDNYSVSFVETAGSVAETTATYTTTIALDTDGGLTTRAVSVDITPVGGSATAGQDYTLSTPTLIFPIGSANGMTRTVTLTVNNDTIPEADETAILGLAPNSGPVVITPTAVHTITIPSNDVTVEFVSALAAATERDTTYNAKIVLRTGGATLDTPLVLDITNSDGIATSPTDYTLATTQVTFPAGSGNLTEQLVTVNIIDDQTPEADEDFSLSFSLNSGVALTGDTIQNVTILNNALLESKLFAAGNVGGNLELVKSELDGSSPLTYTITNGGVSDIAVDDITNTVFRSAGSSLYRHDLTNDSESEITLTGIDNFFGVFDLDPFTERLYIYGKVNLTDTLNSIIVTDFDGNFISSDTITGAMIDMAVDPFGEHVYWTAGQTLYRLPLAGGSQVSYTVGADMILGSFDLDPVNSRLYFTGKANALDTNNSIIETDLLGNRTSSFTVTGGVSDMAVDPVDGYVYRLVGSTLYRHLISTGSEEVVAIATTPTAQPFQIDISYLELFVSLAFTSGETSGAESVANPPILTLTTTNDNLTSEEITVEVEVTGGTATGADYTLSPITLTIPVGTAPGTLSLSNLTIVDDAVYENPDETLDLLLSNNTGVVLNTQVTTTYTITNNDNAPPTILAVSPLDDATAVDIDTTLTITFSEAISASTGNILLYEETGVTDTLIETFDAATIAAGITTSNVTSDTVVLTPTNSLDYGAAYYVQIESTAVQDLETAPFAGLTTETAWNFETLDALIITATLQGRTDNSAEHTVSFYENNPITPVLVFTTTADITGTMILTGIPAGTYTVTVKTTSYLQAAEPIVLTSGTTDTLDFGELLAGDANGDNAVNILDLSILAGAYNTNLGDAAFNATADFNGSDGIDILDLSLLASNYGVTGETP